MPRTLVREERGWAVLYFTLYGYEDFETGAHGIVKILNEAQTRFPGLKRHLVLSIEGHREADGTFEMEAQELQISFVVRAIHWYFTRITCPMYDKLMKGPQNDDVPETLIFTDGEEAEEFPEDRVVNREVSFLDRLRAKMRSMYHLFAT